MEHAIEIRHLTKDYGSFKLSDVSFCVPGGSIVGLIGENGAGKSTTIKCILNLIRRDAGEILLLGRDNIKDERLVKEDIGVVLDESTFHDTLKAPDVGKILRRVYKHWDSGLFQDYLRKFRLPTDKYIKEFSRGMKMKLSIAAALSSRPKLLILDEATGGLDPVVRDEILDEFLSYITSDLEKVADYVVYLHRGQVAIQGAKDELLERYGRLVCSRADMAAVDGAFIVGQRTSQFGCEALIQNKEKFRRLYPGLTVDPVTLEEIMVFTVKGDVQP